MDQTALPFLFPHLRTSSMPERLPSGPMRELPVVQAGLEEGDQLHMQHLLCVLLPVATETENRVTNKAVTNIQLIN